MKDRFIETVLWALSITAAATLFFIITIVPALYMTGLTEEAFLVGAGCGLIAASVYGFIWIGSYIIFGQKLAMTSIFKVFGKLSKYFWFLFGVLYIGVTSRQVVRLFLKQLWFEFVPVLHGLQGRLAAQGRLRELLIVEPDVAVQRRL